MYETDDILRRCAANVDVAFCIKANSESTRNDRISLILRLVGGTPVCALNEMRSVVRNEIKD